MLVAYMVPVVYLVEQLGRPVDYVIETMGAPAPRGGISIALLVATPEAIGAVSAALANRVQRSINIFLGSVLATIGLTIPSVIIINHLIERPIVLAWSTPICAPYPDARRHDGHLRQRPDERPPGRRPSPAVRGVCAADVSGMSAVHDLVRPRSG